MTDRTPSRDLTADDLLAACQPGLPDLTQLHERSRQIDQLEALWALPAYRSGPADDTRSGTFSES